MQGPAPKEKATRRNTPTFEPRAVEWDGVTRGFDLPVVLQETDRYEGPYPLQWHERTQKWWDKWRNSAQAMVMQESDWEALLETAVLHTRFWNGGLKPTELANLSAQISRRVASYGATYEDRLKLRLVLKNPTSEPLEDIAITQDVKAAIDYATRLTKKAAELKGQ